MSTPTKKQQIHELLHRGVGEIVVEKHLKKQLEAGKKLRIKFGIDPTGFELHLGHAVPLRKLRQFQDAGHHVILLIGDYTAMVGDPTGRNETRPSLTRAEVKKNMRTYVAQASKILDIKKTEIRYNGEWYKNAKADFIMELTGMITAARIMDRADFKKRLKEGSDIHMQELLYPIFQGYDSVALKSDVEIGGMDQKLNMLMGRRLQKKYGQVQQDVMMFPLLVGTDGEKKMSKTYNNYVALLDKPEDMFGKLMGLADDRIVSYFELCTDVSMDEIKEIKSSLKKKSTNPRDVKMRLAEVIVRMYHSAAAAKKAKAHFVQTFQKKAVPDDIPSAKIAGKSIIDALVASKLVSSKSEARRVIKQRGVKIDGSVATEEKKVKKGSVIQKGKRHFVKVA